MKNRLVIRYLASSSQLPDGDYMPINPLGVDVGPSEFRDLLKPAEPITNIDTMQDKAKTAPSQAEVRTLTHLSVGYNTPKVPKDVRR